VRRFLPLLALGFAGVALAQEGTLPSFTLTREDREILVQQTASDAEGGIFVSSGGCRENISLFTVYAPAPKLVETMVNNTRITSRAVLREQPSEGGAEAQDQAVLDFFGGTLELNEETLCPTNIRRAQEQTVTLVEGRTTVEGVRLLYENATGVGEMTGPIQLNRRAEEDSPALTASSRNLSFDVDTDLTTLRGDVQVESEGRTSEAQVLELDEEAGFAVLRGNPARSRTEEGEVAGEVIEYDLDSNDVVVRGEVDATFNLGDEATDEPSGAAEPEPPPSEEEP